MEIFAIIVSLIFYGTCCTDKQPAMSLSMYLSIVNFPPPPHTHIHFLSKGYFPPSTNEIASQIEPWFPWKIMKGLCQTLIATNPTAEE